MFGFGKASAPANGGSGYSKPVQQGAPAITEAERLALAKAMVGQDEESDDDEEDRIKNLTEEQKQGGYDNPYRGNAKPLPANFFQKKKEVNWAKRDVDRAIQQGAIVKNSDADSTYKKDAPVAQRFSVVNNTSGGASGASKAALNESRKSLVDSVGVAMKVNKFVHRMSTQRMKRTSHPTFGKGMTRQLGDDEDEIDKANEGMATGTSRKRELTGDMGTKCVAHLKEPLRSKYTKVCLDLRDSIYDEDFYDDGTYAPMMIRLCVHACLTWDKNTKTGGIEGATMRFKPEKSDAHNKGLDHIFERYDELIRPKHPWITHADLWVLGAYVAIECSNGPIIPFTPGRRDSDGACYVDTNTECCPVLPGRLPMPEAGHMNAAGTNEKEEFEAINEWIRHIFLDTAGVREQDVVALISGGHTYGRCHPELSGYAGPWQTHPGEFNNVYCKKLLQDEWKLVDRHMEDKSGDLITGLRPKGIRRQYVNKNGEGNIMMLPSDLAIRSDPAFNKYLQMYWKDEELLRKHFAEAYEAATMLGFTPPKEPEGIMICLDPPIKYIQKLPKMNLERVVDDIAGCIDDAVWGIKGIFGMKKPEEEE